MKRRTSIIEAAQIVFFNKGFEQATMQEIAAEASLGVATIFRYFPKKEQLIVAVASEIVQSEIEVFKGILHDQGTCYDKLERIFDTLIFFQQAEHQRNSKLIEAFECYVSMSKLPLDDMEIYQANYNKLITLFTELAELGEQDGSLRTDGNTRETINTMINVFGNFSKKMAMLNGIDAFQTQVNEVQQFNILKKLFLDHLRA
ncbi:TetR/AcrR family transcriptional regulator [Paenibacillus sp. OK003]|uniref:TetR/AcrR family transcriptional regulator n=1 Tax=Paenibacillus sp. OK003 TaxID=1884380 RepID=UPI0008C04FCF|nr:TetR/AcrR family transcriptional regulator [Paenibacillus sp. OK003]SEK61014.1 transcriptional regulator, TetR family [Paenibacillus sp. OK003]